ncbi:MAG: hypothetical protein NZ929_04670 [Aigarchaeota archaeon]|nr:hypothetical protein [Aigarchaeota archaeon]MCX8193562.1 hypothetical protein [Nitrososphaeria archaeon]MDW7986702.1 hypothetical protein [Nitrososphaerota archaeon]
MDLLSFIIPGKLVNSILSSSSELKKRLVIGVVFLAVFIVSVSLLSSFFIEEKIEVRFELTGFEELKPQFPTFPQMLLSRTIYVGLAIMIIFIILRFALYFIKKVDVKVSALITLILSSFIILLIATTVITPILIAQPKSPYIIVDAELQEVKVYNGTFTGYTKQGVVSFSSPQITIGYLRAYRVFPDMKMVNWRTESFEEIQRLISESKTVVNMSNIKWVEEGVEKTLDELGLADGRWTSIEYNVYLNALWINVGPALATQIFSLFLPVSWGLTILFIVRCFMKLYQTSTSTVLILWIIIYFVFFFMGLL